MTRYVYGHRDDDDDPQTWELSIDDMKHLVIAIIERQNRLETRLDRSDQVRELLTEAWNIAAMSNAAIQELADHAHRPQIIGDPNTYKLGHLAVRVRRALDLLEGRDGSAR